MAIRSACAGSAQHDTLTDPTVANENSLAQRSLTQRNKSHEIRRYARRQSLRRIVLAGLAAVIVAGSTGCTSLSSGFRKAFNQSDCIDDFMIGHRNRVMALKAWYRERDCHCNKQNLDEFQAGFIQGYIDVAEGSDGCTPAVAPSEYWGWKYQSPNGQCAVNSWFAGYPLGVKAAEQDGVGHWGEIRPTGLTQPYGSGLPGSHSYPTQPYHGEPTVIFDEHGVPMLTGPGVINNLDASPASAASQTTTDSVEHGSPSDSVPEDATLQLQDALDGPAPNVGLPNVDAEAGRALQIQPLGSTGGSTKTGSSTADLAEASDLVPYGTQTTYSLNDASTDDSMEQEAIQQIFGAIDLPNSGVQNSSVQPASNATQSTSPTDSAAVETADASDALQFKFE
ncbi:hypothetical protein [Stieleria varia]|uniref:Uncharacterized protein n=1 Tax=Stieleria varia TaxID=2528005 RepID=A0A5C6AGW8_9BACT|nr:hypothetical protein [Stieleria varia]TWT98646.1 hypothetical protein Pla52n_51630 [Stieleria varia]